MFITWLAIICVAIAFIPVCFIKGGYQGAHNLNPNKQKSSIGLNSIGGPTQPFI
jgi:hypothetical protein